MKQEERNASSGISPGTSTRNANHICFWNPGRHLESQPVVLLWGKMRNKENHTFHLFSKSKGTQVVKAEVAQADNSFILYWEGKCGLPHEFLLCFPSHRPPPLGGEGKCAHAETRSPPSTNLQCFPEQISSYKTLSCCVIALVRAENVSHFLIYPPKGGWAYMSTRAKPSQPAATVAFW